MAHTATTEYSGVLRERLREALPPEQTTLAAVCELDTLIGQAFAEAAEKAIHRAGPVDLVVSHGQTVYHWIHGARALGTLQIGQPAWIAERTGSPVLSDVRIRDITVGGQGAPLVSYLDALLLGALEGRPAALNLGGIANMTLVADGVTAYDIGPANALIDAVVVESGNELGYDLDGRIAAAGVVDETLLDILLQDPYYRLPAPKSTGKEHFHGDYVRQAVARTGRHVDMADTVATLTELTVQTVVADVRAAGVTTLVASGGGVHNPVILAGLRNGLPDVDLVTSDRFGAPTDDKEAIAFALIGWCTFHGLPGTVSGGTGAEQARILGSLTPGAAALRLPEPLAAAPVALTLEIGVEHDRGGSEADCSRVRSPRESGRQHLPRWCGHS